MSKLHYAHLKEGDAKHANDSRQPAKRGKGARRRAKKSDALNEKAGKARSVAKIDQAASRLEAATDQWETQAPFIFETVQALDETRLD
jgi:hypothetical protein